MTDFAEEVSPILDTISVGGVPTVRLTGQQLADLMVEDCHRARRSPGTPPKIVVSSNGATIAQFHSQPAFRKSLLQADVIDADGMPLVIASRLFCSRPLQERVATTDFIHTASEAAVANGLKFYFLGAKPGVAEEAARRLRHKHRGLKIVGIRDGYFRPSEEKGICEEVQDSGADVLWVGLGSPRQERFAVEHRDDLRGVGWIRTCGGLFDHTAGAVPRAPQWMQDHGLEWLHRVRMEPRRLAWRYLTTNPAAAFHLVTKTHD